MPNKPRLHNSEPQFDTSGDLMPDLQAAIADKCAGMSEHAIARKHGVTKERLRRAVKTPQGSQLMRRIKREMRLPDKLGKEELLHKIKLWIEREEVKEEAKLPELVGAAMNYARLAGYLEAPKVAVQNNVVVGADVPFAAILQRVADRVSKPALSDSVPNDAVDV